MQLCAIEVKSLLNAYWLASLALMLDSVDIHSGVLREDAGALVYCNETKKHLYAVRIEEVMLTGRQVESKRSGNLLTGGKDNTKYCLPVDIEHLLS